MDMSEYREIFKAESEEHLHQLNRSLLAMEHEPDNMEHISTMFRSAHTLKGMAATMGFQKITELTHEMENLMDGMQKKDIKLDNEVFDSLFECIDTLEALLNSIDNEEDIDISAIEQRLKAITQEPVKNTQITPRNVGTKQKRAGTQGIQFTEKEREHIKRTRQDNTDLLVAEVLLDESCILKAARSSLVLHKIEQIGEIITTLPSLEDLEDENFELDFSVVFSTNDDIDGIKESIENTSEVKKATISPLQYDQGQEEDTFLEDEEPNAEKREDQRDTLPRKQDPIKSLQSIRVNIEQLDSLMNLVGELIINKSRLKRLAQEINSDELREAITDLGRLTNDIQTEVMESRMVPIEQIFSKFPRMIRDLAKAEDKEIDLIIEGGDIKLDRTVLDEIGDPLVHILRNSVDHGIEEKGRRESIGKPRKGSIRLCASRHHNNILIEIEDDGMGIDPKNLRRIAVEKGLLSKDNAGKLSDNEALNLVFLHGFSSAEKITEISGRGVGMDVVKNRIESLGGNVKLESITGEGTRISMHLPPTVAIIRALMVMVGAEKYAVPVTNVVKYLSIGKDEISTINGEEVIMVQEQLIPLLRMDRVLGVNMTQEENENLAIVVVERMENRIGLVVDELLGHQEVIIKPLENRLMKDVRGFSGATIMGDGSVVLILDISTLA